MADEFKYGVADHLYKPMVKRGVVDFAVAADWTPAAGDVKISKDGGAAANVTNLPVAVTMGNTAYWDFSLTATEFTAKKIVITVSDSATKAVEDQMFEILTYGNASAQKVLDFSLQPVTPGTGAGQLNVNGGRGDANQVAIGGYVYPTGTFQNGTNTTGTLASGTTLQQCCPGDTLVPASGAGAGQFMSVDSLDVTDPTHPVATLGPTGAQWPFVNVNNTTTYTIVKGPGGSPAGLDDIPPAVWGYSTRTSTSAAGLTSDGSAIARESTIGAPTGASVSADVGTLTTRLTSTRAGNLDNIPAIKSKTDNLPAAPADEALLIAATNSLATALADLSGRTPAALISGRMNATVGALQNGSISAATFSAGAIDANALGSDAVTEIMTAIRNMIVETDGNRTLQQVLSIVLSVLAGKVTDDGDTFQTETGNNTRAAFQTDDNANRTAVTLTPSG